MADGALEDVSSFMGLLLVASAGTIAFIFRGPRVPMTLYWNSTAAVSERLPSSAATHSQAVFMSSLACSTQTTLPTPCMLPSSTVPGN